MTAIENVELPMLLKGELSRSDIHERAKELLTSLGLAKRLDHYPNMLSGGEQQRVTIARALSNKPELLLMDEPTGDLDTKNADYVVNTLMNLNRSSSQTPGITMVMVTHDENMKKFAHRVIHIMDGKIQRHEVINPEIRRNAIEELATTVKRHLENRADDVGVQQGADSSNKVVKDSVSTVERAPKDYPYIKYLMNKNRSSK